MPITIPVPCPTCHGKMKIGGGPMSEGVPCSTCNMLGTVPSEVPRAHVRVNPGFEVNYEGKSYKQGMEFDLPVQNAVNMGMKVTVLSNEKATVTVEPKITPDGKLQQSVNVELREKGVKKRGRPRKVKVEEVKQNGSQNV